MADSAEPSADTDDSAAPAFTIGDLVHDREDDDPNDAIVVNLPSKTPAEWTAYGETTVAEDNPEYSAEATLVVVGFADALKKSFPDWDRTSPLALAAISNSDASHYAFPAPRLTMVESTTCEASPDETERTDADSDTPTATTSEEQELAAGSENDSITADAADDPSSDDTPITEADLSESMRALKDRLEESMTVEIEPDGQALAVTKLGDSYRVRPGEVIDGEGALRSRLASIVAEYESTTPP